MPSQMPGTAFGHAGSSAPWATQPQRGKKSGIDLGSLFGLIGGGIALIAGLILLVVVIVTATLGAPKNDDTTANSADQQSEINKELPNQSGAGEVVDDRFGFRFSVPYGFSRTNPPTVQPNTLYTFTAGPVSPTNPPFAIQLQRLHGTIDPDERLSEENMF